MSFLKAPLLTAPAMSVTRQMAAALPGLQKMALDKVSLYFVWF